MKNEKLLLCTHETMFENITKTPTFNFEKNNFKVISFHLNLGKVRHIESVKNSDGRNLTELFNDF